MLGITEIQNETQTNIPNFPRSDSEVMCSNSYVCVGSVGSNYFQGDLIMQKVYDIALWLGFSVVVGGFMFWFVDLLAQ